MEVFMRLTGMVLSIALGCGLVAQEPVVAKESHYVSVERFDLRALLPEPPAAGSVAAQADLLAVLQAQAWRTPEQERFAKQVDGGGPWDYQVLLNLAHSKSLPRCEQLFKHIRSDMNELSSRTKDLYARPRPPKVDAHVKPCVFLPGSGSYPSGHTFRLHVWAGVWAELFPDRRSDLLNQARAFAWGRVLGGVHFPTDLVGGELLAQHFLKALIASPEFQKELEACRQELKGAALAKVS